MNDFIGVLIGIVVMAVFITGGVKVMNWNDTLNSGVAKIAPYSDCYEKTEDKTWCLERVNANEYNHSLLNFIDCMEKTGDKEWCLSV